MSTKIYNGYQINKNMSAFSLMNLMTKLSKDCQEICNDLYHTEIAKFISLCLDTKLIFGEEEMNYNVYFKYDYTPSEFADSLYFYIKELIEQHSTSNERFQSTFDFKCSVKLMPIKNKTLFLLYTEKEEYQKIFGYIETTDDYLDIEHPSEKYPQISPYPYYNNTDKPDNISDEDWDIRRDEWNKALRQDENGFKFDLIKIPYMYNTDILSEKINEMYEERIEQLAVNKVKDIFMKNNKHLIKNNNSRLDYINAFSKYSKTQAYKSELELAKEEIINILPKTYSKEDFKNIKLKDITK